MVFRHSAGLGLVLGLVCGLPNRHEDGHMRGVARGRHVAFGGIGLRYWACSSLDFRITGAVRPQSAL